MILNAIFDNFKSTNIANITNSKFDNKHQFYVFYAFLSFFVNFFSTFFFNQFFHH
jgi:hypothetical protein